MTTTTFEVPDISCDKCKARIESGLGSLDGVAAVAVDVAAKQVAVTGTAADTDLREALSGLGYPPAD